MDAIQIQQVRRFNRLVTRRVGALDHSYLSRGRPLGEARLIFEIGLAGAEVRSLRAALGLDSGYLSRLLRALTAEGLVEVVGGKGDARVRRVALTARGRRELAAYDRLSDDLARSSPRSPRRSATGCWRRWPRSSGCSAPARLRSGSRRPGRPTRSGA
jgi:DNA-binding MarR family transcriptional regulator